MKKAAILTLLLMAPVMAAVNLVSPADNTWTSLDNDSIEFTFNYTELTGTVSCTLYIDGVASGTNSSVTANTNTIIYANHTISEGSHAWYVNCSNSSASNVSATYTLNVDRTAPTITITSPTDGSYVSGTVNIQFNVTDTGSGVNQSSITVTGAANITFDPSTDCNATADGYSCTATWDTTAVSDGSYTITVTADDSVTGNPNSNSTSIHLYTNNYPPTIIISKPANNSFISADLLNISVRAVDKYGVSTVKFRVEYTNGTNITGWIDLSYITQDIYEGSLDISSYSEGLYVIRFFANDTQNKSDNTTTINFAIDRTPPTVDLSLSKDWWYVGDTVAYTANYSDNSEAWGCTLTVSWNPPFDTSTTGYPKRACLVVEDCAGHTVSDCVTYSVIYHVVGGGGGARPTEPQVSTVFPHVSMGEKYTYTITSTLVPLTKVEFKANKGASNFELRVKKVTAVPEDYSGKVYQYVEITSSDENVLGEGTIYFKVEKSWLQENGVDKENVVLLRYEEGKGWTELDTQITDEDDNYVYYQANTPGFSYFAIAEKTAPEQPSEQPSGQPSGQPGGQQPSQPSEQPSGAPTAAQAGAGVWIWIIVAIVIIAIIAAVLYMRK